MLLSSFGGPIILFGNSSGKYVIDDKPQPEIKMWIICAFSSFPHCVFFSCLINYRMPMKVLALCGFTQNATIYFKQVSNPLEPTDNAARSYTKSLQRCRIWQV